MADTVSSRPTEAFPTHHIELSDGVNTIGLILCDQRGEPVAFGDAWSMREAGSPRTSLQIRQGDPTYSDYELPYTPVTQSDFSGGRGLADFEKDKTRYYDATGVDPTMGDIVLGPRATATTGLPGTSTPYTNNFSQAYNFNTGLFLGSSFQVSTDVILRQVIIPYKDVTGYASGQTLHAEIWDDFASAPNHRLSSGVNFIPGASSGAYTSLTIDMGAITMTAATTYWLIVYPSNSSSSITFGVNSSATGRTIQSGVPGVTWPSATVKSNASFAVTFSQLGDDGFKFFEYRGQLYAVSTPPYPTAARLFENGHRGTVRVAPTSYETMQTSLNLSGVNLAGYVVKIAAGTGFNESTNWRTILSNTTTGTNDTITVTAPWKAPHDTTTEFVILGENTWREITGHGLTRGATSVAVVDDIIYIAQGRLSYIRRGKLKADGTWETWADDGTNEAHHLLVLTGTDGKTKIWRSNGRNLVGSADAVAWGTNLTFGTDIVCGSDDVRITNLIAYGNPLVTWVMKEDGFGSITSSVYSPVPLGEFSAVRSEYNGAAAMQYGVYLYMSFGDNAGLERYYDQRLDDVGPNRDEGLPSTRQGPIRAVVPYPGRYFAAVNGGASGYSSVMVNNGNGWHEVYRGALGEEIQSLFIQAIPGIRYSRLWISSDNQILWIPVALNPRLTTGYSYAASGSLITSWINGGWGEINKFWRSVRMYCQGLSTNQTVTVYYQTDNEGDSDAWHLIDGTITDMPSDEALLETDYSVDGRRLRFKIELASSSSTLTPRVRVLTTDIVTRIPPKASWSLSFVADDSLVSLRGTLQKTGAMAVLAQLNAWSNSDQYATPITMRSMHGGFDNLRVFIERPQHQPIIVRADGTARKYKHLCSLVVVEA